MTSSRRPTTLKFLRSWFVKNPEVSASVLLFLVLWVHGSTLGLSDDEAYYWVLAQRPALGYAFHPPAVAWMIAFFQFLFSPFSDGHSVAIVRLPAAFGSGLIFWIALSWLKALQIESGKLWRAVPVLLSFFGFFALSWMIVPDIPLFLGLTLAFSLTWKIAFEKKASLPVFILLAFGVFLSVLGKYSGIFVALSSAIALILWAPRQFRTRGLIAVSLGLFGAAIPILLWNAQHHWASILYQIRDRHGGDFSLLRYVKFWLTQLGLVGPLTIYGFFYLISKGCSRSSSKERFPSDSVHRVISYVLVWCLPPASIYFTQPLFGDFKPHWAFVAWWPVVLALSYFFASSRKGWRWIRYQSAYGLFMGGIILLSCHFPFFTWFGLNPRNDVTNDLYGWADAEKDLEALEQGALPVVGARYQTAAQAAFQFSKHPVTFIPRSMKEWDEWPDLGVAEEQGPEWPVLKKSVFYVADNRYDAGPSFKNSRCVKILRTEKLRMKASVGWIDLWHCDPT